VAASKVKTVHEDERRDTAAAVEHLRDALRTLVEAAEASLGPRCPHRVGGDVCTYPAACENQLRPDGAGRDTTTPRGPDHDARPRCGGDGALSWDGQAREGQT
jgi:hypothetical protein